MAITFCKSKRAKLGYFKNEKLAWESIDHYKKYYGPPKGRVGTYYVLKVKRSKEGMKSWWAYCLHKKECIPQQSNRTGF